MLRLWQPKLPPWLQFGSKVEPVQISPGQELWLRGLKRLRTQLRVVGQFKSSGAERQRRLTLSPHSHVKLDETMS